MTVGKPWYEAHLVVAAATSIPVAIVIGRLLVSLTLATVGVLLPVFFCCCRCCCNDLSARSYRKVSESGAALLTSSLTPSTRAPMCNNTLSPGRVLLDVVVRNRMLATNVGIQGLAGVSIEWNDTVW